MNRDSFLSVRHLSAGYGNSRILEDVSFDLEKGTITGLLGANGSGKSTLMKSLCCQLSHQGECLLEGQRLEELSLRQRACRVSYIPQRSGISISLSVMDVVLMGFNPVLRTLQNPGPAQRKAALRALAALGLEGMEERDYLTLSEGQKQLCILARMTVEDGRLLLLDEPDGALDFRNRYHMLRKLVMIVKGEEKAALVSLHDPALALNFCDRLLLLKKGRCIAVIEPAVDEISEMEDKLSEVYGPVSLVWCLDKQRKKRLAVISEQ